MELYTAEDVRVMIREAARKYGVNWIANGLYLSAGAIWYSMNGKRAPSSAILDYLGLEKVVLYRKKIS